MNRIQELRERKNLSQAQLAEQLGVSTKAVQAWECGESTPDEWVIGMLCSILDCSPDYLLGNSDQNVSPSSSTNSAESTYRIQPITCPRCGSRSLAFVTEYHKEIFLKIAQMICTVLLIVIAVSDIDYLFSEHPERLVEETIPLIIFIGLFSIARHLIESKTHVQAICKDCGNLWLLN